MSVELRVRFAVDDVVLSALHDAGFGSAGDRGWQAQLEGHSLSWVGAFDGEQLVGFVNVAWDGGAHAFLLDAVVAPAQRRQAIGQRLVRKAAQVAAVAGCQWLHVDYEPQLHPFYVRACGFTPSAAGVLPLPARDSQPWPDNC